MVGICPPAREFKHTRFGNCLVAFGVVGANSILMRCTYFNLTGIVIIRVFRIDAIEVFINKDLPFNNARLELNLNA